MWSRMGETRSSLAPYFEVGGHTEREVEKDRSASCRQALTGMPNSLNSKQVAKLNMSV
jgi:hypothetical protein